MFKIVTDGKTVLDEKFNQHPINDYSAVFVKFNQKDSAFFRKTEDKWYWETQQGIYDYQMPDNYLGEDFVKDMKAKEEFPVDEKVFYIRVFERPLYSSIILPQNMNSGIQYFAANELNLAARTMKETISKIYNGDEDKIDEVMESQIASLNAVQQVVELIVSQNHSPESLSFLMKTVDTLMRGIPLTPITEDDSEWTEYQDNFYPDKYIVNCVNKLKEKLTVNEGDEFNVYVNVRCPYLVKVSNITEGDIKYYNCNATIIKRKMAVENSDNTNEVEKEYHDDVRSVEEITMPWSFVVPNLIDDTEKTVLSGELDKYESFDIEDTNEDEESVTYTLYKL